MLIKPISFFTKVVLHILVWGPLLATVYAIYSLWGNMVSGIDLTILLVGYIICGFGITVGYHRMLTHKSFDTSNWVRAFFLICGSMALQGSAIRWAATHIQHHANSDEDDDPHTPVKNFFHAHVGWILDDFHPNVEKYAAPLLKDKLIMFISNTFFLWVFLGMLIPYLIDGWHGLLWGGGVRIFLNHHITWAVNSVCHTYGRREFITTDSSCNNAIMGFLALGEGWHNNHHAFPRSANHGMHWWQIDPTAYLINFLEKIYLVRNVVRISQDRQLKRRLVADIEEERDVLPGLKLSTPIADLILDKKD